MIRVACLSQKFGNEFLGQDTCLTLATGFLFLPGGFPEA
jgi:hypothetical protein